MVKVLLILVLVFGFAMETGAALALVDAPTGPIAIGQTTTITVRSTTGGDYSGWLEIADSTVANFAGAPQFTPAGNPAGTSSVKGWPDFGAWYEFQVTSLAPNPPIEPGNHILVDIVGLKKGITKVNLYAGDGIQLWECAIISVIPEPATMVLLGVGGLLLYRRR